MKAFQNEIWSLQAKWRQIDLEQQSRIRNYFNETQAMKHEVNRIECLGDKIFQMENQKEVVLVFLKLQAEKDYGLL